MVKSSLKIVKSPSKEMIKQPQPMLKKQTNPLEDQPNQVNVQSNQSNPVKKQPIQSNQVNDPPHPVENQTIHPIPVENQTNPIEDQPNQVDIQSNQLNEQEMKVNQIKDQPNQSNDQKIPEIQSKVDKMNEKEDPSLRKSGSDGISSMLEITNERDSAKKKRWGLKFDQGLSENDERFFSEMLGTSTSSVANSLVQSNEDQKKEKGRNILLFN